MVFGKNQHVGSLATTSEGNEALSEALVSNLDLEPALRALFTAALNNLNTTHRSIQFTRAELGFEPCSGTPALDYTNATSRHHLPRRLTRVSDRSVDPAPKTPLFRDR
jgi:hypothetical protein